MTLNSVNIKVYVNRFISRLIEFYLIFFPFSFNRYIAITYIKANNSLSLYYYAQLGVIALG